MKLLLYSIYLLLHGYELENDKFEAQGVDALKPKKKGRQSMKKESTKHEEQELIEGSVEAVTGRDMNGYGWKTHI